MYFAIQPPSAQNYMNAFKTFYIALLLKSFKVHIPTAHL